MELQPIRDRIPFRLANGATSVAAVMIFKVNDRTAVVCMDDYEGTAVPVNEGVELLFDTVCRTYGLNPVSVFWIEYSPPLATQQWAVGGWERVNFSPPRSGKNPEWVKMTDADWMELGIPKPNLD